MLIRLVIDTASLSIFSLNNVTYSNQVVFLYTIILFVCGVIATKLWLIKSIGKTFYKLLPQSLTEQWQAYDEWVIQTKKIFNTIEALRQSEERFRVIFEEAAVGISHTDIDGRILRANPKFCEIVGYSEDELMAMRFQDITYPDDLLTELPLQQKVLKLEQTSYHIEKRYISCNSTLVWIKLTVSVICNSNDEPIELIKVIEDISDRKRAEEALKQQQLFSEKIAQANPNSLYIYDLFEQRTTYINRHAAETLGYSVEEVEAMEDKFLPLMVHPEDYDAIVQHIEQIKSAPRNRIFELEYRLKDAQNRWRWFHSRDTVFTYTEDNQPKQILGVAEEITYRKNAELALRRSEERYRSLVAATSQMVCISDADGNLTQMLAGAGYRVKDIERLQRVGWVERIHPEDRPRVLAAWQSARCNKSFFEVEHRLMDASGEYRYMQTRAVPVLSEDGSVREWISAITDISVRKQAEAELRASEKRCRESARVAQQQAKRLKIAMEKLADTQAQLIQNEKMSSLGQLVAGVAHEINNPVNFIYGNINPIHEYAQDLLNLVLLYKQHYPEPAPAISAVVKAIDLDFIQEDLPKILDSMKIGADRILQIVLSLRNFSRLDEASLKAVDIHEGIDSTLLILQSRLNNQLNTEAIEVVKEYGAIEKIECYAGQLNQVFMNILNNAIDAIYDLAHHQTGTHYKGKIVINTSLNEQNQVVINITDNGCGMTEETLFRIYDPFFTTKPVGSGTGLGMAVSYKVIEKHGGKLECSSILGQGTKFTILLPKCACGTDQITF